MVSEGGDNMAIYDGYGEQKNRELRSRELTQNAIFSALEAFLQNKQLNQKQTEIADQGLVNRAQAKYYENMANNISGGAGGTQPMVGVAPKGYIAVPKISIGPKGATQSIAYVPDPKTKLQNQLVQQDQSDRLEKANKNLDSMLPAVDQFKTLRNSYYGGFEPPKINLEKGDLFGAGKAKAKGFVTKLQASVLGQNPQAKAFLDQVDGFATSLSRGVFQEKGTLTDKDRGVIAKMFNLAFANKNEADFAFGQIEHVMTKGLIRNYMTRKNILGEKILNQQGIPDSFKAYFKDARKQGYSSKQIFEDFLKD